MLLQKRIISSMKHIKGISKEPYANRQPKIKFDAKTLVNGMDKEEPSQKRDPHRQRSWEG